MFAKGLKNGYVITVQRVSGHAGESAQLSDRGVPRVAIVPISLDQRRQSRASAVCRRGVRVVFSMRGWSTMMRLLCG